MTDLRKARLRLMLEAIALGVVYGIVVLVVHAAYRAWVNEDSEIGAPSVAFAFTWAWAMAKWR
jgi:hypothetical protein